MFTVNDLAVAKAFYTARMGFGIAFENEWYLALRFEDWGSATSASRTPTASTWISFKPSRSQRNIRRLVTPDRPFRPPNFQAFNVQ
jgi:hypothetical protein